MDTLCDPGREASCLTRNESISTLDVEHAVSV